MPARNKGLSKQQSAARRSAGSCVPGGPAGEAVHPPRNFLTSHSHVLIVLHSEPDLVLREVALRVGITERAVQRIVQELEEEGYLRRKRVGRRNHYHILVGKHLRHPVESHCTIDQILTAVTGTNAAKRNPRPRTTTVRR